MKFPKIKINEWTIVYKKINQFERCFVIFYEKNEISKIMLDVFQELECAFFPLDLHQQISENPKSYLKFINRVKKYDLALV